jgi:hypothetical protein
MMEAVSTSETLLSLWQTVRHSILEVSQLHTLCRENSLQSLSLPWTDQLQHGIHLRVIVALEAGSGVQINDCKLNEYYDKHGHFLRAVGMSLCLYMKLAASVLKSRQKCSQYNDLHVQGSV